MAIEVDLCGIQLVSRLLSSVLQELWLPIGWRDTKDDSIIEFPVGTVDEEYLLGVRDTAEGKPHGGYGIALANPAGDQFHVRNQIPGVTDRITVSGVRFWKGSADGPMTDDKLAT